MYVDSTGTLRYPGEIHNQVIYHIVEDKSYSKEQTIDYKNGGKGRADIISSDGHIWDVKRDKPEHIAIGQAQVIKYTQGTWRHYPERKLQIGDNRISSGEFNYQSGLTTYKVTYRNAGNGVIAYDYEIIDFDEESAAEYAMATLVVTAIVAAGIFLYGLRGSLGMAGAFAAAAAM